MLPYVVEAMFSALSQCQLLHPDPEDESEEEEEEQGKENFRWEIGLVKWSVPICDAFARKSWHVNHWLLTPLFVLIN